jgi:hypothetical protein
MEIPRPSSSFRGTFTHNLGQLARRDPKRRHLYVYLAAAMIAALLVIYTLVPSPSPNDIVYNQYYETIDVHSSTNDGFRGISPEFIKAVELYYNRDYRAASTTFLNVSESKPQWVSPRFYAGISAMELEHYPTAIEHLTWVVAQNRAFIREAKWYLGLAYLKIDEVPKATSCFEELSSSDGIYQNSAREILNQIK